MDATYCIWWYKYPCDRYVAFNVYPESLRPMDNVVLTNLKLVLLVNGFYIAKHDFGQWGKKHLIYKVFSHWLRYWLKLLQISQRLYGLHDQCLNNFVMDVSWHENLYRTTGRLYKEYNGNWCIPSHRPAIPSFDISFVVSWDKLLKCRCSFSKQLVYLADDVHVNLVMPPWIHIDITSFRAGPLLLT